MSDRRTREAELVRDHGLTQAEAELAVAIEEGEATGLAGGGVTDEVSRVAGVFGTRRGLRVKEMFEADSHLIDDDDKLDRRAKTSATARPRGEQ